MKLLIVVILIFSSNVFGKVMSPTEFTNNLRNNQVPEWMWNTWNCIVQHESAYDTNALNSYSGDHGIFQISQIYWCSPPGNGCGLTCASLHDDDISNDIRCAMQIYKETASYGRNGFSAWTVYYKYCA